MDLERELRSLAEADNWGGPVVSVYLDARWRDESQRERLRVFWDQARSKARRDGIDARLLEPIDRQIEALIRQGGGPRAAAIFSSRDQFRVFSLPVSVGQYAFWGAHPALLPLARAASEGDRALVAVVGAKLSRMYELQGGQIRSRVELDRLDFPGRHEQGGFAQPKFQRHIKEHIRWELESVQRALVAAFDREPCSVFICGTPQVDAMFFDMLPRRIQDRAACLGALSSDPRTEAFEVQDRVARYLDHERVTETLRMEERVWQEAQGGGAGALGAEDVVLALQEGRVQELLLREDLQIYGGACPRCGALEVKRMTGCPYCGETIRAGELSEDILRLALRSGARVRFMLDRPRHQQVGGIAALLRPVRGPGWMTLGSQNRAQELAVSRPS